MFAEVPHADAYTLKMIHNWSDRECVRILRAARESVTQGGRLFVIEHIIPGPAASHFAKLFDIHMLCWGTGRERTQKEYVHLLEAAGWKYCATWYPANQLYRSHRGCVVEDRIRGGTTGGGPCPPLWAIRYEMDRPRHGVSRGIQRGTLPRKASYSAPNVCSSVGSSYAQANKWQASQNSAPYRMRRQSPNKTA